MSEEFLSPRQAGEIADCHNDTIRRAIEAGFLPAQRVGRNWIIKRKDLNGWIEAGKPNRRRTSSHNSKDDGTGES
jgi:excisionase family DNA binding protein